MIDHETQRMLARERIDLAVERATRLAEAAPRERPRRVRRQIGSLLIAAGRRLAPDAGASARPAKEAPMRARAI
jgi:hypothetical protein